MTKREAMSPAVGLVVADLGNPFFIDLVHGVGARLENDGFICLIGDCGSDPDRQLHLATNMIERGVVGLIVTVPHNPKVMALDFPLVAVDRVGYGIPYVGVDNVLGGKLASQHLKRSGYDRSGILYAQPELAPVLDRLDGFRQGLRALQVEPDPALEIQCQSLAYDDAYDGALLLLQAGANGIFAVDDVMASAALAAATDRGLLVPDQIGVVGYDDTPMAAWPSLSLTSIAQGTERLGEEAAGLILKRIHSPNVRLQPSILPPRLVTRGSTARAEVGVG